jgi:hypothetical protein
MLPRATGASSDKKRHGAQPRSMRESAPCLGRAFQRPMVIPAVITYQPVRRVLQERRRPALK